MMRIVGRLAWAMLLLTAMLHVGCEEDCTNEDVEGAPALAFVGSETCGECHEATYDIFIKSGHPYKLTEVTGNTGPVYPYDAEHSGGAIVGRDGPPPGTTWDQFAYVIGGYGWKARWVKPDGNVYTDGTQAQLNLHADGPEWVPYTQDQVKPYNYSCYKCHTTGAVDEGSWPEGSSGFGTFVFGGVQCEGCHGMGSQHAFEPEVFKLAVDSSPEACGRCHTRDAQNRVAVSGGFIKHHEQFDEHIHSPHAALSCVTCHDPHASVVYDDVAPGEGVKAAAACVSCHEGYDVNLDHLSVGGAPECVDCHMPDAAKSARAFSTYQGDVASHTFTIRTDAVGKDAMWTEDGKFVALDEIGRGRITLDFACYGCHKDEAGEGGEFSIKTLAELSAKATGIHDTSLKDVLVKNR